VQLRTSSAQDVAGKTVLVRVDYNVPLEEKNGRLVVADDRRIEASLETIQFLLKNKAKVVLVSHLGRPENKESKFSLRPVAEYIQQKFKLPLTFINQTIGDVAMTAADELQPGTILLLENVRFHEQEEQNDPQFAQNLASLADAYINEAFSAAHRAHASTEGVTRYLPSFAGFNLAKEVEILTKLLTEPQRPFYIIVGGAKISDKVGALTNLAKIADAVLVGGGVANNFLKAEGLEIHHSYLQDVPADLKKEGVDYVAVADDLIESSKTERILIGGHIPLPKIIYPIDVIAAQSPDSTNTRIVDLTHDAQDKPDEQDPDKNLMYLDIGPKTVQLFSELIAQAGSVFWNGPMGYFEKMPFQNGTKTIAQSIAASTATTVIGGGDTVAAVEELGLEKQFTYISTAGGAGLEFLSGVILPGIKPLISR
jgi:3-phosphoglycerate kinase